MPPLPASQKGTGKKRDRDRDAARQSQSRNTTPNLVASTSASTSSLPTPDGRTALLDLPIAALRGPLPGKPADQPSTMPNSASLEALSKRLKKMLELVETRGEACDKGMRILAGKRKTRAEQMEHDRRETERKELVKLEALAEEERSRKKATSKNKKNADRPLTHGAHGLAPQDGPRRETSTPVPQSLRKNNKERKMSRDLDSASSSLSPIAAGTPAVAGAEDAKIEDDSSSDEHQGPPAPRIPNHMTFGPDPSIFPDPTVYEIAKVEPGMSDEELKRIYSVSVFPHDDLQDLIPGNPPDKDFSNAKPMNQVQPNTFATYIEPYFRPFTEEDLAFLRERGDRHQPFSMPRRSKKHYKETWAEEDGAMSVDSPERGQDKLPENQPRGSVDELDDNTAETSQVSAGPTTSRLLAILRPENRPASAEDKTTGSAVTNGDHSATVETNGDLFGEYGSQALAADGLAPASLPPATFMPDSSSESWKKAVHPKLDHAQIDERMKQELRHLGFLGPDNEPDHDAHYDDPVAARLRELQERLKEQCIVNGARKARIEKITKERMAHQEYTTILEDLDSQVQTAFLKRTRTLGKAKKNKRPGGAGGGSHFIGPAGSGTPRPGIGEITKTLMERRDRWIDNIGPVFDDEKNLGKVPRASDPDSSIFKPEDMIPFEKREKETWDEEAEEE